MDQDDQIQSQSDDANMDSTGEGNDDASTEQSNAEIVAEPRKPINTSTVVITVLLVVAIAGTYLMMLRSGPRTATASPGTSAVPADAVRSFLDTGPEHIRAMRQMLHDTEKVVQQFINYPSAAQVPLSELQTNPFHDSSLNVKAPETDEAAALKKQREEARAAAIAAAGRMHLQSVLMSGNPSCMIDGHLYTQGQVVQGFTVEKIKTNSVIIRNELFRFEISMPRVQGAQ